MSNVARNKENDHKTPLQTAFENAAQKYDPTNSSIGNSKKLALYANLIAMEQEIRERKKPRSIVNRLKIPLVRFLKRKSYGYSKKT